MRAAHIVYLLFGGQCKGPGFSCIAWRDPSLCPPIVHPSGSLHAHISQKGNCGGCSPLFPNLPRSRPVGSGRLAGDLPEASSPCQSPLAGSAGVIHRFPWLSIAASRYWPGPLVLSTAFLGCHSLPVATGRVRWCYPPLSLAVTRCQSLLAGSAGITRHLAGLALAAGCYRPCSSVIDIAANYDWPVLLELNRR